MDEMFYQNLVKEIKRKESVTERKKEDEIKKEKHRREFSKEIILHIFDNTLQSLLKNLKDFNMLIVTKRTIPDIENFSELAKELGFDCIYKENKIFNIDSGYCLTVPEVKNEVPPTTAQLRLLEFNEDLLEARKKRKEKLLEKCQIVKKRLEEGHFQILRRKENNSVEIWVQIAEDLISDFEMDVIGCFFAELNLIFCGIGGNHWIFEVSNND